MSRLVYVEEAVRDHPRTRAILGRLRGATVVPCARYGEVFNPRRQSFRLQKRRPALILAAKHGDPVLPVPSGYGLGADHDYYVSHVLNCPYDCRYCFLQGMYRSAHQVVFVTFEELAAAIDRARERHAGETVCFFSGYDGDSLALEGVTGFAEFALDLFAARPDAWLELRTKSARTRELLARDPLPNVIVAYSLSPANVARALEHGAPSLERRLSALSRVAAHGWLVGLRFDPLIHHQGFRASYDELFDRVLARVPAAAIHSVTCGAFRLPAPFFRRLRDLYPEEPLFSGPLEGRGDGLVTYRAELEAELLRYCRRRLEELVPAGKLFVAAVQEEVA